MANGNFVVQNGLTVGPLTIDAATGSITTSGNVSITGNLGVSQISKNDSSIGINDTGTGSTIAITLDGANAATFDATGLKLPSGDALYINGTSVLNATTLGSGVTTSSLTSVGTIATGTWNATTIGTTKGGTGLTAFTSGGALYATSTSALTTGTLPVASGGTGVTTSTGSGSVVLSASPTFTGTVNVASISASGDAVITGNLTVNGTTTTINVDTVTVEDKNITLANVATPTDVTADGGGITVKGATDKTFNWTSATSAWVSSEDISVATGKGYEINGTSVLTATTLGSGVTASSLTSVGTLTGLTISGQINSTVATGTAPLAVASTTLVSNLNADLWDGNHFSSYLNQAVLTSSSPTFAGLTVPSITHSGTSGTGDIGGSGAAFGTVWAKATSAQYADLAEYYAADAEYEPGTVVCFGGEAEVTLCDVDACRKIAGVVSTNPAYIMNNTLEGTRAAVALQGRVPVKVVGPVQKGDMMVAAGNGRARAEADPKTGAVIGKALENFDGAEGVIEVVIGRV